MAKVPLNPLMRALEYGAGTGITSFYMKDHLKEIIMMDNSAEMVKKMNEKILLAKAANLKALFFDLEHNNYTAGKFDLIFTQMVLHHVMDTENITARFYNLLNPGGYLAIADLYPEDGSFHGNDFIGHKGFDTEELSALISRHGFTNISHSRCFVINKKISDTETRQFDVFLLTACKTD
jgi:2-polyprenyl-3-methyl-5-hydroxy-6-metoxy-1,4-benzoquinol methylase